MNSIELDLLRRSLERMKLINGPEEKCVYASCRPSAVTACPNHQLMREIENYLTPAPGKERK